MTCSYPCNQPATHSIMYPPRGDARIVLSAPHPGVFCLGCAEARVSVANQEQRGGQGVLL